jgi:hypothetical protein
MNVEIGTKAARNSFSGEYKKWEFRCSALYTVEEEDLPDGVELDGELAGEDGEEEERGEDDEGPVVALLLDQRPHTLQRRGIIPYLEFHSVCPKDQISIKQCCGSGSESGSTRSTCFWASWIRIRIH